MVTDVGKRTADAIETPTWVFLRESQDQVHDNLPDTRSAWIFLATLRVIPFLGDQLAVPAQDRVRGHDGGDFHQRLTADGLALDGQLSPLVIGQKDPFLAQFRQQSLDLIILKRDDLLLTMIHQSRNQSEGDMPRLQYEIHGITGFSDSDAPQHLGRTAGNQPVRLRESDKP